MKNLVEFLSENTSKSSRRLIAYRCSMFLLIFEAGLIASVCWQACNFQAIDNGLLTLTGAGFAAVVWLSKQIFYRPGENNKTEV